MASELPRPSASVTELLCVNPGKREGNESRRRLTDQRDADPRAGRDCNSARKVRSERQLFTGVDERIAGADRQAPHRTCIGIRRVVQNDRHGLVVVPDRDRARELAGIRNDRNFALRNEVDKRNRCRAVGADDDGSPVVAQRVERVGVVGYAHRERSSECGTRRDFGRFRFRETLAGRCNASPLLKPISIPPQYSTPSTKNRSTHS